MADSKTTEIVYTKKYLIQEVAEKLDLFPEDVEYVYETLVKCIIDHLLECNERQDVLIRFYPGMRFYSKFIPQHYHVHPTEDYVLVPDKIKLGFTYSKSFKRHAQNVIQESREMYRKWMENRERNKKTDN